MPSSRFRGAIAGGLWLIAFQLLLGLACVVDGVAKLGWLSASAASAGDFQPSPLGGFSAVVEIVAGLFVLVGFRTRAACVMLACHLVVGLLAIELRDGGALGRYPMTYVNVVLMAGLLVFGPSKLSVDLWRRG